MSSASGPSGIEVEFKRRIPDAATFEALIRAAGGQRRPAVEQENHFFDAADGKLAESRVSFRLRREAHGFTLTLKGPSPGRTLGGPSVREEIEWAVEPERGEAVLSGDLAPAELLAQMGTGSASPMARDVLEVSRNGPLGRLGSFCNERTRVETTLATAEGPLPVVLEFDRTQLPGDRVDFEVELELEPGAPEERYREALDGFLRRAGVEPEECPSKLARFRETLAASGDGSPG